MNFEEYVRSLGYNPETITIQEKQMLSAAWEASKKVTAQPTVGTSVGAPDGLTEPLRQLAQLETGAVAEETRQREIFALCQRFATQAPDRTAEFTEYAKLAIAAKVSAKDAELEFLRRAYKNGPLAYSPSKPVVDDAAIEVGLLRASGHQSQDIEKLYDDRTLSAADRHFRGGCGIQQTIVMCARANGMREADTTDFRNTLSTKRLLQAAFDVGDARASASFGPSTHSASGIFSNALNKSVRIYWMSVEGTWRIITATRPVTDFKEVTGYALTGNMEYQLVPPGGKVKHGTFGEGAYGNKAALYALMLGLDYQQMRNDDAGALNTIGNRLGRGSAITINKKFWAEALAGQGSFWVAGNQNYRSNADVSLSDIDNLDNVSLYWMTRKDPDGELVGDKARYLVVPPKYDARSKKYMRSLTISNDGGNGSDNVHAGAWEPLTSGYLSDANTTGADTDGATYLLVSDPAVMPFIEVVFLDGQEMPTIDSAEPDLSQLGMMFRGMHGFGVRKQEPRGAYMFDGVS